jgi:hypothetical protein
MDSEFLREIITRARGMAATLREADQKLAVITAALAQSEHEAQGADHAPEPLPDA